MAGRGDAGKDAAWRRRLARFRRSGLTVARFCDGDGVSVGSFYYWRKKLEQTAWRRGPRSRPGAFRQIDVVPALPGIIAATPAVAPGASAGAPASSRMVILLPGGTRIEVDAERLDAVRAVVGALVRADDGVQTGIGSC